MVEVALGLPGRTRTVGSPAGAPDVAASPLLKLPARLLSQVLRAATGIEIHPGAVTGPPAVHRPRHGRGHRGDRRGGRGRRPLPRHHPRRQGLDEPRQAPPHLGDRVLVGAGAKVLGPVRVGDDAQVGANAVVVKDVPAGAVAVGVPARARPARRRAPCSTRGRSPRSTSEPGPSCPRGRSHPVRGRPQPRGARWQRGHQKTRRPAIVASATVVPHTRHGRPERW